jgi:hypothetical protein
MSKAEWKANAVYFIVIPVAGLAILFVVLFYLLA